MKHPDLLHGAQDEVPTTMNDLGQEVGITRDGMMSMIVDGKAEVEVGMEVVHEPQVEEVIAHHAQLQVPNHRRSASHYN